MKRRRDTKNSESEHVPIRLMKLCKIQPSPENDKLYRPVRQDDPEVIALAKSIRENGLLEPLIITRDEFLVSGHRRYTAAIRAGLDEVPCRQLPILRSSPEFLRLLREANRQRVKTRDERLREEVLSAAEGKQAYQRLLRHREQSAQIKATTLDLREYKARAAISSARKEFLAAVENIINELVNYWPLSDRQIHYQLLNQPPLIHASKPRSRYRNDQRSYRALSDLLTRARHEGIIDYNVIADATRPVTLWKVENDTGSYVRTELKELFMGYARNFLQSQPNHIEIVAEKLTLSGILRPIAAHFRLPLTIGRGYCSTRPKHDIAQRYRQSGKERLSLLIVSDFDPDGDEIAQSLARSLRDDFNIFKLDAVKVALTSAQVQSLQLPPSMLKAKHTSANFKRFVQEYGSDLVYELEAVAPQVLQDFLEEAIRSVLDIEAFNAEIEAEKEDAAYIEKLRRQVLRTLDDGGIANE